MYLFGTFRVIIVRDVYTFLKTMKKNLQTYSDIELTRMVAGSKTDSESAFTELYNRYASMVHAYCYRVLNDRDLVEDIFQDTFIKFYQTIKNNPEASNISGFLITMARNQCLNHRRDTRPTVSLEGIEISDERASNYDSEEVLKLIEKALDLLDYEYKEVFIMREYDGLSYNDIGEICGISSNNAKSRVFRARLKMREILSPYLKEMC